MIFYYLIFCFYTNQERQVNRKFLLLGTWQFCITFQVKVGIYSLPTVRLFVQSYQDSLLNLCLIFSYLLILLLFYYSPGPLLDKVFDQI